MTDNTKSYANIEDGIQKVDAELAAYDALNERIPAQQETCNALSDDVAALQPMLPGWTRKLVPISSRPQTLL